MQENFELEKQIVRVLKNIFDPEIPVNIYDLGLIYEIDIQDEGKVEITMTLTSPNCPIADQILLEVNDEVLKTKGVNDVNIDLTFDPPWDKSMMTEEAKLELGFL